LASWDRSASIDSLAYHRPGLHVRIEFWTWNQETGFTTTVERTGDLSSRVQAASLGRLYVACGLGPASDVPETAGSGHALRKRITQHSSACNWLCRTSRALPPQASSRGAPVGNQPAADLPEPAWATPSAAWGERVGGLLPDSSLGPEDRRLQSTRRRGREAPRRPSSIVLAQFRTLQPTIFRAKRESR